MKEEAVREAEPEEEEEEPQLLLGQETEAAEGQ